MTRPILRGMARRTAGERSQLGLWLVHEPDTRPEGPAHVAAFFLALRKAATTNLPLTVEESELIGIDHPLKLAT